MNAAPDRNVNAAFVALSNAYAGTLADPYPLYRQLLARGTVYDGDVIADLGVPSIAAGRDGRRRVFCLLGNEVVTRALIDADTFSTEIWKEAFTGLLGDPVLLFLNGPEHRFTRGIASQVISPNVIRAMGEDHFRPTIEGMVRSFAHRGRAELMSELIVDFPIRVIYDLFGLPNTDPAAYEQFSSRALTMVLGGLIDPRNPAEAQQRIANAFRANGELYEQILAIVRGRRAGGDLTGYDMISQLLRREDEGRRMSDEQVALFVMPYLAAAGETTTRAFANMLALLLERPAMLEQVRRDRSLIKAVINETMRYEGSVSVLPRLVTRDIELGGVRIPAGSGVNIIVSAANRDPAAHQDPEEFSLRPRTKPPLSFGFGPHMCMGMPLAKVEMELALNAVLDLLPNIRFDPAAPFEGIKGIQFRSPTTLNVAWDA